jgi:hypothetical protein
MLDTYTTATKKRRKRHEEEFCLTPFAAAGRSEVNGQCACLTETICERTPRSQPPPAISRNMAIMLGSIAILQAESLRICPCGPRSESLGYCPVARLAQWKSTSFTRKGPQVQVLQRAPFARFWPLLIICDRKRLFPRVFNGFMRFLRVPICDGT